jgi:hypothetical protein
MSGVLLIGYALVLGSYNFILTVSLVPAVAYAGGYALWRGEWRRLFRWGLIMLAPLVVSGAIFAERVAGLKERFVLFQAYDFGWRIPLLTPEGWLGMVAGPGLNAFAVGGRVALAVLVTAALVLALWRGVRARRREVFLALCLTVPALGGYGYLHLRGWQLGTNASYDAYKFLFVFYPGVLAAVAGGVIMGMGRSGIGRAAGWILAVVITAFTLHAADRFVASAKNAPLVVDRDLAGVQQIEALPEVESLNMLIPDMWSRLWANAFLLRKPQYFLTHTYEGRRNTPLRGEWDLDGGLIELTLPDAGSRRLSNGYTLVDTRGEYFLRASLPADGGWYEMESLPRAGTRWRWSAGNAGVQFDNPQHRPLRVVCELKIRSVVARDLDIWLDGKQVYSTRVDPTLESISVPEITLPSGRSRLELRSSTPPVMPGGGDVRQLGFAVYGLKVGILPDAK